MVFSLLILIFNVFFVFLILPGYFQINKNEEFFFGDINEFFQVYFPSIGISLLIIFTELFHVITVNTFIELLPSEDLKFYCFKMSTFITIITKLTRIFPSCIIILIKSFDQNIHNFLLGKQFVDDYEVSRPYNLLNLILFGLQSLNYIINFILLLSCPKLLKRSFMNRILANKI